MGEPSRRTSHPKTFSRTFVRSSFIAQCPACPLSFFLQVKQLVQPLKSKSYKCMNSVCAPIDLAPSRAFCNNVAVFQVFLGLPLTAITFIASDHLLSIYSTIVTILSS